MKFGLFYELQLPKPADADRWDPDAERRIYHEMLEQVELADKLGFDYVFESAGTPSLYAHWLRPSIFAAGLWTEPANSSLHKGYASIGAQVDMRISVLHTYDMTLSAGFAAGFQGSQKVGTEWMISLKIM